ncbi:MAG: maleylpyruvate isomerase family mycothiol-dependent enzyme [Rhodococcus sp. (in: high G+C Gram-positive bacteria)]|uniref:maleylpyruvate isomerase family mycothiol-dependent enzyme n=1 Tax=Rhodococcus sp. EPR-157 TaxID=1813677 RepID=UPI0007BC835C|nr:maleylpyruvate isomerase family mycothiol-dependent enzyme [Rhodococcus sp. EPR-157]KZF09426.1 hypothetical protein A2J03_02615 [Rhodococcus sp. EPR-157]
MDVSVLHTATECLAEYLSEVTQGDLGQSTPAPGRDIGDLYLYLIDRNITVAAALMPDSAQSQVGLTSRSALDASVNVYGGGFEERYRRSALQMEDAFASVSDADVRCRIDGVEIEAGAMYDQQVSETVIHTWDVAHALGLTFHPPLEVAHRILKTLEEQSIEDVDAVWESALRMSGRLS